jgi:hypothetical protein
VVDAAPHAVAPPAGEAATPRATKALLVATLLVDAGAIALFLATKGDPVDAGFAAWFLLLFTGLFLVRVAGQLLVRARGPGWLPPSDQWHLMPYRLLLPTQLAILAVMAWLTQAFFRESGAVVDRSHGAGLLLLGLSFVYAGAMVVRYAVRMARRPEERWFGGTIPIVFHLVLASHLFVLGSFHAS